MPPAGRIRAWRRAAALALAFLLAAPGMMESGSDAHIIFPEPTGPPASTTPTAAAETAWRGTRPLIIIEWGNGMNAKQVRAMIRRVLHYLEPEIKYSESAVELLMLTAAQESHMGEYLAQLKGPARGIYQMEPESERCLMEWLKSKRPDVYAKVAALNLPLDGQDGGPSDCDMWHNLAYQTAMARAFYLRKPGAIPKELPAAAQYYKDQWNTYLGKATPLEALANYRRYCYPLT